MSSRSTRSAVIGGTSLYLGNVDERGAPARLFHDLITEAERERGGKVSMTILQRVAVRTWAAMVVDIERMTAEAASTGKPLSEAYGVLCDRADRQARRMGPVKAPPPKDIRTHLASKGKP